MKVGKVVSLVVLVGVVVGLLFAYPIKVIGNETLTIQDVVSMIQEVKSVAITNLKFASAIFAALKEGERNSLNRDEYLYKYIKSVEDSTKSNSKFNYEYAKSITIWIQIDKVKIEKDLSNVALVPALLGTGVIVKKEEGITYILTCYHVVRKAEDSGYFIRVKKENGDELNAYTVAFDAEHDLAIIEVDDTFNEYSIVKGIGKMQITDKAYTLGNGFGFKDTYGEGMLVGYDNVGDMLFTIPTSPGDSGSGVYNSEGYLVSIMDRVYVFGMSLDFTTGVGIHTDHIKKFLKDYLQ